MNQRFTRGQLLISNAEFRAWFSDNDLTKYAWLPASRFVIFMGYNENVAHFLSENGKCTITPIMYDYLWAAFRNDV